MNENPTAAKPQAVTEADVSVSMLNRVRKILERAEALMNQDPRDVEKLSDELKEARLLEIEQANQRAAQLIAKYGIDRAMLAATGKLADSTVDEALMVLRPFASKMMTLLWIIADSMGARATYIKTWNPMSGPKARGGKPRGGYDYGLRIFAWESDLERIKLLYTSLRNQALKGASGIVDASSKFGQTQKAERESYLDGWTSGLYRQLQDTEREARERAEAEQQEARDRAMENGEAVPSGPRVSLVLVDRKKALDLAWDAANGITPADRAKWAEQSKAYAEEARQQREARAKEIEECAKCQKAKTGRCNEHKDRVGRTRYRSYKRIGSCWGEGFRDGKSADLGPGPQVGATGHTAGALS